MKKALTFLLLLTAFTCLGTTIKVAKVIDGDTFVTQTGEKVRLLGINAPEMSQSYGQEAKLYLSQLIHNKSVILKGDNISSDRDRYKRLLRYVLLDGTDINKKMVSDGFAYAFLRYNFDKKSEYKQAEIKARKVNKGLWGIVNEETNTKPAQEKAVWQGFSANTNYVNLLIIVLLLVGLYSYFRK